MPKGSRIFIRAVAGFGGACVIGLLAYAVSSARDTGAQPPAPPRPSGRVNVEVQASFPRPHDHATAEDPRPLKDIPTAEMFQQIASVLGIDGVEREGAYRVLIPRRDLFVLHDGNEVPVGAGVEHAFYFYRCPCGTMIVHGHYLLQEFEVNDVIDALRQNPDVRITGTGTFLIDAEPRLALLRFQGEGEPQELASTLRRPFRHIGPNRNAIDPTDTIPR